MERLRAPCPVPEFSLHCLDRGPISNRDLEHGRTIVCFHRYAACPICNSNLAEFKVRQADLAGVRQLHVFHSPEDKLRRYIHNAGALVIAADPEMTAYAQFRVTTSLLAAIDPRTILAALASRADRPTPHSVDGPATMVPANFLVCDGEVVALHYGKHFGDAWTVSQALEALTRLGQPKSTRILSELDS